MEGDNIITIEEVFNYFKEKENRDKEFNVKTANENKESLKTVNETLNKAIVAIKAGNIDNYDANNENLDKLNSIEETGIDNQQIFEQMLNSLNAIGIMVGGLLSINSKMAEMCINSSDNITDNDNTNDSIDSDDVNYINGKKYKLIGTTDEGALLFSPSESNLPVLSSPSKGKLVEPESTELSPYNDDKKQMLLVSSIVNGKGLITDLKEQEKLFKTLGESKFGKSVTNTKDPFGGDTDKAKKILKALGKIEKEVAKRNITRTLGIIGGTLTLLYGLVTSAWSFFSEGKFRLALISGGLAVATVLGGEFLAKLSFGLRPTNTLLGRILSAILSKGTGGSTVTNVGRTGKSGMRGLIKGGLAGLGAGLVFDYVGQKVGETLFGEKGGAIGGAIGGTVGGIGGMYAMEMASKGIPMKHAIKGAPKFLPKVLGRFAPLAIAGSVLDAGTNMYSALTTDDESTKKKSWLKTGISVAGPLLGGIIGTFLGPAGTAAGITIGSTLSSLANAIIDNTDATKDNTEAERVIINSNSNSNNESTSTSQNNVPVNNPTGNKDVISCLESIDKSIKIQYKGNEDMLKDVMKDYSSLLATKSRYRQGNMEESTYTTEILAKSLKKYDAMNDRLATICDNTKVKVEVAF